MTQPLITLGDISIAEVSDNDVPYLHRWLNDPEVLAFYEGRDKQFSLEQIRSKYLAQTSVTRCIVRGGGAPVAYIQFYPLGEAERGEYGFSECTSAYGMDQFIGDPSRWGSGLGPRMIRLVVDHLIREGAEVVTMDPRVSNTRAIRAYEKCGFKKSRILPKHEEHEGNWEDAWLMELTAASIRS
jgi:aminoglycoside 6'-N-acetyltransferase